MTSTNSETTSLNIDNVKALNEVSADNVYLMAETGNAVSVKGAGSSVTSGDIDIPAYVKKVEDKWYKCTNKDLSEEYTTNADIYKVTSIEDDAFYECSGLTEITIPSNVTSIGSSAFGECYKLVQIRNLSSCALNGLPTNIGQEIITTGNGVFTNTLEENGDYIVFVVGNERYLIGIKDKTVTEIKDLDKLNLTQIYPYAFYGCSGLTGSITIPEGVTSIGTYAFYGCSGLTDVYYSGTEEQWNAITIGSNNTLLTNATINYLYGWTFVKIITEPTCTEKGVAEYQKGEQTKNISVPALGHNSENGKCTRCGEDVPTYELKTSGDYGFELSGDTYTSNNKGKNSSTATTVMTVNGACNLTINWTVSSEANYDKYTIKVTKNGVEDTKVNAVSVTKNGSFTIELSAGDEITFIYSKDLSSASGSDCAIFTIVEN
ncbi:MAG: leucine-rich repeat domain-containing protein [Christensenellales bacterium]